MSEESSFYKKSVDEYIVDGEQVNVLLTFT